LIDGGVIGTGFEQQNAPVRILAQARGQNRARRTSAHDDVVILHLRPLLRTAGKFTKYFPGSVDEIRPSRAALNAAARDYHSPVMRIGRCNDRSKVQVLHESTTVKIDEGLTA
jgi:hypothetical protein